MSKIEPEQKRKSNAGRKPIDPADKSLSVRPCLAGPIRRWLAELGNGSENMGAKAVIEAAYAEDLLQRLYQAMKGKK